MYEIIERYGSIYCTEKYSGEILYELNEPAVIFSVMDKTYCIHRLGNKDKLNKHYEKMVERVRGTGAEDLLSEYFLADLPKDVEILNKVYNNSTYLGVLFKEQKLDSLARVKEEGL